MSRVALMAYEETRRVRERALPAICYAPYANLFFNQLGKVQVCCWNTSYVIGDIREQTIEEMWHGEVIRRLREAVSANSFDMGCELCAQQIEDGGMGSANMRWFDRFAVDDAAPEWPQRIELSISNVCNLECVMCSGEFSSAIRSRRENLPRRPQIYPADFADSLRKFLPHLKYLKFLGGEPFLVREYYRIWEMMIADGLQTPCHVTTNGTQFNSRIERVLGALPFGIAVSLDGATKATVESIRVNADFADQLRILRILRDYTREKRTDLSLTYCFMRQNWQEFGEFCAFGDSWECNVAVNTVVHPPQFGVYNLPKEELRIILDGMERQAPDMEKRLARNRRIWFSELERVRGRYARLCNRSVTGLTPP